MNQKTVVTDVGKLIIIKKNCDKGVNEIQCINCVKIKNKLKLSDGDCNVFHMPLSEDCKVYQRKLKQEANRTVY